MVSGMDTGSPFWSSLEKRIHAEWLIITLSTLLLTLLLGLYSEQTSIARLDHTFYDGVLRTQPLTDVGHDIVIIAIDDTSIEQLGHWPWRRSLHAQLLERLGGARAVGFDIVFTEPNDIFPEDDRLLAEAIRRHGRVILPTIIAEDPVTGPRLQKPLPALAHAAAGLGYINIYPQSDGTVRSFSLRRTLSDGQNVSHFTLPMLGTDTAATAAAPEQSRLIPYAGPAGHFPFYPYAAVLRGEVPAERFHDRLVLVGAWGSGLGDTFPTPMTYKGEAMSGVEILANGLHSLQHGRWIQPVPVFASALLGCLPVALACLMLRRYSPRISFLATVSIMVAWAGMSALLVTVAGVWQPITASLVGMALAFPLWSWRSQEASLRHIDQQLLDLELATAWEPDPASPPPALRHDRSLPARVRLLHNAIARFRHVQNKREETLRFLSHDMRAPQNAILAMIQMQRREPGARSEEEVLERIERRAHDTLELMDGFVQLERAEVQPLSQSAIELGDLLQEACDACWELARHRGITLEVHTGQDLAWVKGDRKLLERVLRNLMDNAIKYSPNSTRIHCRISRVDTTWHISIEDQGRGIPAEQLERIFEPFTRVASDTPGNASGAGLGLAFVRTTIQRHRGTITAYSQEGQGSVFVISLPANDDEI